MYKLIRTSAVAAVLAAAPLVQACNRQPDVKEHVDDSLKQAKIDNVNTDYDKQARVLHLKGKVQTSAERQRAEEVASAAVGTSGTVLNELTVEGVSDQTAGDYDGAIRDRLHEMIDNDATLKDRDVNFDVNNGVVTAKGEVRTAAEKEHVSTMVRSAPGVKDFANELVVKPRK